MIKFRLLSLKTKLYADNPKEVTIMKEGIHPKYEPTEVAALAARSSRLLPPSRIFVLIFAQSAIRSSPASRSSSIPADALTASRSVST